MCLGCLLISCAVSAQTCACQAIALRVFDQVHTSHPDLLSRGLRCQLGSRGRRLARSVDDRKKKPLHVVAERTRAHTHTHVPHTVKWHIRASHLRSPMRVCVRTNTFVLLVSIISAHTHQCERVCVCFCAHIRHTKTLTNSTHTTVTRRCVATSRRQSCCLAAI